MTVKMVNDRGTEANVPADAVSVWEAARWKRVKPAKAEKAKSEE